MDNILNIVPNAVQEDCIIFNCFSETGHFWNNSSLNIFHMNIGKIQSHFNELMLMLAQYLKKIDIIILSETWYHPSNPYSFSIAGYTSHFTCDKHNEASGIAVYVRSDLDVQVTELNYFTMTNCLKLDIKLKDNLLTLLAMYRSPSGNVANFLDELDQQLPRIRNDRCLLVGDININILEQNIENNGHEYSDIIHGHNYIPTITQITREKINTRRRDQTTYKTISCIDHINYKSRKLNEIQSAIIHTNISDHYSTITKLNIEKEQNNTSTTYKNYIHIDYEKLNEILSNENWNTILESNDPDYCTNLFTQTLKTKIDQYSSTKTYSNRQTPLKPWMTQALLASLRNRDRLARLTKQNPHNLRLLNYYKRVRNIVSKSIRIARDLEFKRNIDENQHDKRKLWTVIKSIIDKPNKKSKMKTITHDNTDYNCETDTKTCANIINNYFNNIGKLVSDSINSSSNDDTSYNSNILDVNQLTSFEAVTSLEILKLVKNLRNNSAPGDDELQTKLLKNIIPYILTPLTHIINLSLSKGVFPTCYKNSIIVPIHKKGSTKVLTNYRPISLLTIFSKILEKTVQTQLDKYLQTNNTLTDRQYGFRKRLGTEDALIDLTTYLYDKLDKGKRVIALFLDISKAYDSIKHTKLLQQLHNIGLRDNVLTWFSSYLTDRTQQVRLNSHLSDRTNCQPFSIVQGSCLGPVLFNCFINTLPGHSQGQVFCYADDAVICYSSDTWEETHNIATTDLNSINNWYNNMSLKLNFDKTNYMTFSIDTRGQPNTSTIQVKDGNNTTITLQRLTKTRYLGVLIDQHLKWTDHITQLKCKLRHLMYIFNNLKRVCSRSILREVYFALAQSLLQYCIVAWGGAYKNLTTPLNRTLNILIRLILDKDRFFHSEDLYRIFEVPTIQETYIFKSCVFSIKKCNMWEQGQTYYNTRQRGQVTDKTTHKSLTQRHFSYVGSKIFNRIPEEIKNTFIATKDIKYMRYKLKEWLKIRINRDIMVRIID